MNKEEAKQQALFFLKTQVIAVLATLNEKGYPAASTIYFAIDDDFTFYFATKIITRKYKNLQHDKHVALVIGTENIPVSLQVEGQAEEIEDVVDKALCMDKVARSSLQGKYGPPLNKFPIAEIAVFKIKPETIRFLDQTNPQNRGDQPVEIIP